MQTLFLLYSMVCAGLSPVGTDEVQRVRADFNKGVYSEFLEEMSRDYSKAKQDTDFEGMIEIRKGDGKVRIDPAYADGHNAIVEKRNRQLLAIVEGENTPFAQKVRSAIAALPERSEELFSLGLKAPGAGANREENQLIDIHLEYYYKSIHLNSTSHASASERRAHHFALEMEKASRMMQAAQTFKDKKLKAAVERDVASLDKRLTAAYDMEDLLALAKGKTKPASEAEQQVAAVVWRAQGEIAELHRQLWNAIDD